VLGLFARNIAHEHVMQLRHASNAALAAAVAAMDAVVTKRLRDGYHAPGNPGQPCRIAVPGTPIELLVGNWHDLIEKTFAKRVTAGRRAGVVAVISDLFTRIDGRKGVGRQDIAERFQFAVNLGEVKLHLHRIAVLESRGSLGNRIGCQHIVRIQKQHEVTARRQPSGVVSGALAAVFLEHRADLIAVSGDDSTRIIGRTIIDHDDFQRLIGLCQRAVNRIDDEFVVVVIYDHNGRQVPTLMH